LISRGYENIIVLRIFGWGIEKPVKIPGHVQVVDIAPRQDLGGILEFDAARSCRNMQLGYFDAKKALYGLSGEEYYLDLILTEEEAYERLMPIGKKYLQSIYLRLEEESRRKAEQKDSDNEAKKWIEEHLEPHIERTLEKLGEKKTELRRIHEDILPEMARKLVKNRSWTYKDLYIKCLEQTALGYGIPVFEIYTEAQLLQKIRQKRELYLAECEVLPEFDVLCQER
jgi:NTE family protein